MDRRTAIALRTLAISLIPLASVSLAPLACGAPAHRELQSITVSPATASAQAQAVQFTATGHWSAAPLMVAPQPASWGVCQNNTPSTAVTVSSAGLAQCTSGAKGAYTVFAADPPLGAGIDCNALTACGGGCQISGSARLTCP